MDDNRITSTDFNYDAYTGGSSSSDSGVTSSDFDYDVYSGASAMEYLRQENERKAEERKRAQKTDAELRREEYEKKFAGMSADELFGMPEKKKKPEDDFSDFFDADEIERQREHQKRMEQELRQKKVKLESMMPGEDTPSSQPEEDKRSEGVQDALEMMAREKYRRDQSMEHYRDYRGRYYRRRHSEFFLLSSLLGYGTGKKYGYGEYDEFDNAVAVYIIFFFLGSIAGGVLSGMRIGIGLICGAIAGAAASFVRRNGVEKQPFGEAMANTRFELIGIGVAAIVGLILEFA